MSERAYGAGGQRAPAQSLCPRFGILLHCEVERRFVAIGGRNSARDIAAVDLGPALEQPFWGIARNILARCGCTILRHAAEHCIDEAGVTRGAAVGLR